MAAPEYVPRRPTDDPRSYHSPPRRPESWRADRPGEVGDGGQPRGDLLGNQGPDQGYVFKLVPLFADQLHLADGEERADVVAGVVVVALKRASLFGRAPVVHDLTVAFTLWGFLDPKPPAELVALRRRLFSETRNPHHYLDQRGIADAVPSAVLRQPPAAVANQYQSDWRSSFGARHLAS